MENLKYDVELVRDSFKQLIQNLVKDTDFEVMYKELNDSDIGKSRMPSVFVLRANPDSSNECLSRELYNGIVTESDTNFLLWIEAMRSALRRTGNTKDGKHAVVEEIISDLLKNASGDTKQAEALYPGKTHNTSELLLSSKVSSKVSEWPQYIIAAYFNISTDFE